MFMGGGAKAPRNYYYMQVGPGPTHSLWSRVSNQSTGGQITRKPESGQAKWSLPSGAFVHLLLVEHTALYLHIKRVTMRAGANAFLMEPQQLAGLAVLDFLRLAAQKSMLRN